ncbi:MAG: hypothetical protein JST83_03310 [Bacteroidetes bacterium]|nr:hypothetical protein [Bacteroidota bacterium]
MKANIYFYVAAGLLLIGSLMGCNPNHPTPLTPSSYKVKTVTVDQFSPSTITYDNQGRIIDIGFPNLAFEASYFYSGSSLTIVPHVQGSLGDTAIIDLDAQGRMVLLKYIESFDDTILISYTYDNAGFMQTKESRITHTDPRNPSQRDKFYYQWVDSCLMSVRSDSNGTIETYSYYPIREYRDIAFMA